MQARHAQCAVGLVAGNARVHFLITRLRGGNQNRAMMASI
jgi:hypothetical protein